jgi:hypothetical protein
MIRVVDDVALPSAVEASLTMNATRACREQT